MDVVRGMLHACNLCVRGRCLRSRGGGSAGTLGGRGGVCLGHASLEGLGSMSVTFYGWCLHIAETRRALNPDLRYSLTNVLALRPLSRCRPMHVCKLLSTRVERAPSLLCGKHPNRKAFWFSIFAHNRDLRRWFAHVCTEQNMATPLTMARVDLPGEPRTDPSSGMSESLPWRGKQGGHRGSAWAGELGAVGTRAGF